MDIVTLLLQFTFHKMKTKKRNIIFQRRQSPRSMQHLKEAGTHGRTSESI